MEKRERPTIKFDYSLIMILLAALILLISFLVYNYKYPGIPVEEYAQEIPEEFIDETMQMGDQCLYDADCPQPRCPGMSTICENGYCVTEQTEPIAARCIDLQTPVCGNNICEADETEYCQEDCRKSEETITICNQDGTCEIDLTDYGYSENEDSENCPEDCTCGDAICDDKERLKNTCPTDC